MKRPVVVLVLVAVAGLALRTSAAPAPPRPAYGRMSLDSSLGVGIRAYRTTLGLTQTQLALLTAIPATRISRIERGLVTSTAHERDTLVVTFDSIVSARFHPDTEKAIAEVVIRVRRRRLLGF